MIKLVLLGALALAAFTTTRSLAGADADFERIADAYVEELLKMYPEWATQLGDHRYDGLLNDRSAAAVARNVETNKNYLKQLDAVAPKSLNATNAIDYQILRTNLERMIFESEVLREWEWNPLAYNMGDGFNNLFVRDFAPLEVRLRSARDRLRQVPDVVAAARANLKNPPRIHTETAILQNKGVISLLRDDLSELATPAAEFKEEMRPLQYAAIAALEAYGKWLEEDLLPRSNGEFRLGEDKWQKKLRFSLDSDLTREQILKLATDDLKATQAEMYKTALPLYDAYFPYEKDASRRQDMKTVCRAVLTKLADEHPDNNSIVDLARTTLEEATAFAREHKLVTIPSVPVRLIVMPEYQRGVAVAYCDPPGPLEPQGETFYAISPTPQSWSAERTESFFREYNNYMLYDLTVHEAMPGHYLQLAHSNGFRAPTMIRAIFYSGSFVEGWAVYSEKVMADAGFGGPKVKMQQLKMRLRVIINAIIDQKIHTAGMTEKEAVAMMMNEGFQEDGEAAGKWRRACLTSTQLSTYFVGSAEVESIRRDLGMAHPKMAVGELHDRMLSHGSPSPRHVRRLMGL